MSERERPRAPPPPEPPPPGPRAADLYPRVRTHYDENGIDIPYTPICAEFVQWVGRMADNGTIAMSNYRIHVQPRRSNGIGISIPLRLVDTVEVRELVHLVIFCKDGKNLKCTFSSNEQCVEWWRRVTAATVPLGGLGETFAAAYRAWAAEQPPASPHRLYIAPAKHEPRPWFHSELKRLGFTSKGAWRVSHCNAEFKLCASYPPLLVVPATVPDEDLAAVARFRSARRIPAVVWRHRGNGAVLARSSQPEVGWLGWRSNEDERLLAAYVMACRADRGTQPLYINKQQTKLMIIDARSYASAVTNRARGGGVECQAYYPFADIQFMCLSNIHHVRRSFHALRQIVAEEGDNWQSALERSLWLQYVSGVARGALAAVRGVVAGRPVLVHCSDGWDRTPQVLAAAQLLLDPYYRTMQGFRVLIEREWLDFGHKFASRCGHQFGPEDVNERSPIFMQWLDLVHQMQLQHPTAFEFNNAYLVKLLTHVHSCMFGTFLCNSASERVSLRVSEHTAHVWRLLDAPEYRNHLYQAPAGEQVLSLETGVRWLVPWWAALCPALRPGLLDLPPGATYTGASRTRSCDNLAEQAGCGRGERPAPGPRAPPPPRRNSDPALPPDALYVPGKMSEILASSSSSSLTRTNNTSSITNGDQVEGLNPNHFESGGMEPGEGGERGEEGERGEGGDASRGLASNSSSLERELDPVRQTAVNELLQAARESARQRHISITWRSVSESSHHSDCSDLPPALPAQPPTQPPALRTHANHNGSTTDVAIHNTSNDSCVVVDRHDTLQLNNTCHVTNTCPLTNNTTCPLTNNSPESPEIMCEVPKIVCRENDNNNVELQAIVNDICSEADTCDGGDPRDVTNTCHVNNVTCNGTVMKPLDDVPKTNGVVKQNGELTPASQHLLNNELASGDASTSSTDGESICAAEEDEEWEAGEGPAGGAAGGGAGGGAGGRRRRRTSRRGGSAHTLCPASPRRRRTRCEELPPTSCVCGASGPSGASVSSGASGASVASGLPVSAAAVDGLRPLQDPLQTRLQQIINQQRVVVEELSRQLRECRTALHAMSRRQSPRDTREPDCLPAAPLPPALPSVSSASTSNSSSCSEVEAGWEATGAWLPDHAARRCQRCHLNFWLARRRHHCRRCGGIFCGTCCSVWSEWSGVRVCLACRELR